MGFSLYYCSTDTVSLATRDKVHAATDRLCDGKTWLSCEPVWFFMSADDDGYLQGGSKPNFAPHPDDTAAAEREGLPGGTIRDVLEVLCELSREFGIDWEFCHDHDPGPIGFIRDGQADADLWNEIATFDDLTEMLSAEIEYDWTPQLAYTDPPLEEQDEGDDEGPQILPFKPRA